MFKRSFMESFKITKYGRQSGQFGRISTNVSIMFRFDLFVHRFGIFVLTAFLVNSAFTDFTIFYELFSHLKQPVNKPLWENSVPPAVKVPNDEIMENWNKLHQMRDLQKAFEF